MLRNYIATVCNSRLTAPRAFTKPTLAASWTPMFPLRHSYRSANLRRFAHHASKAKAGAGTASLSKGKPSSAQTLLSPKAKPVPHTAKSSKAPNAQAPLPELKHGYPERLLIYHAGKGRTIFLASFKLTAVFIFIFSALLIAPSYYFSPFEPTWMAPLVVVGGAIPLVAMVLTSAPYVTYVHLQLPIWARESSTRLHRYAASLPSSAEVDITSMKWVFPRVTRLRARELYLHKGEILGAVTLRREVPEIVKEHKRWYDWKPVQKFYVAGKSGTDVPEPGVWEGVVGSVVRGWGKPNQREKLLIRGTKR